MGSLLISYESTSQTTASIEDYLIILAAIIYPAGYFFDLLI
jgi:hypothetical protein